MKRTLLLDAGVGAELAARGVPADTPAWTGAANLTHPETVRALHLAYVEAGADVITANTFRTTHRAMGDPWREALNAGVALARDAAEHAESRDVRIAGSLAPVMDCYRPDLSPGASAEHELERTCAALADARVDLILAETFPSAEEACAGVRAARRHHAVVWASLTPGPGADLLSPREVGEGARRLADEGASIVCVNCVGVDHAAPYADVIADLGVPWGLYANAGDASAGMGWGGEGAADHFARACLPWLRRGPALTGGCCGCGPAHVAALRHTLRG